MQTPVHLLTNGQKLETNRVFPQDRSFHDILDSLPRTFPSMNLTGLQGQVAAITGEGGVKGLKQPKQPSNHSPAAIASWLNSFRER